MDKYTVSYYSDVKDLADDLMSLGDYHLTEDGYYVSKDMKIKVRLLDDMETVEIDNGVCIIKVKVTDICLDEYGVLMVYGGQRLI